MDWSWDLILLLQLGFPIFIVLRQISFKIHWVTLVAVLITKYLSKWFWIWSFNYLPSKGTVQYLENPLSWSYSVNWLLLIITTSWFFNWWYWVCLESWLFVSWEIDHYPILELYAWNFLSSQDIIVYSCVFFVVI